MSRHIVIRIEVPDGMPTPDIEYVDTSQKPAEWPTAAPQAAQEPEPAWEGMEAAPQAPVAAQASDEMCPVHMVHWKVVPAGVSKKTGKPYSSFKACPATGCEERPRRVA